MIKQVFLIVILTACSSLTSAAAQDATHVWSDVTGNYRVEAEFVARNESSVVLKLSDSSLLIVEIDQLSKTDQAYLKDFEAKRDQAVKKSFKEASDDAATNSGTTTRKTAADFEAESQSHMQCWRLTNGESICGDVVEYGRRLIQLRKRGRRIYVNDRQFRNLPYFFQQVAFSVVNQYEKLGKNAITNEAQLLRWLSSQPKGQKAYTVDGVMIENYRGDLYGVPFFMFDQRDVNLFRNGWDTWLAAESDAKYQAELSLRLRVEAIMRQRKEQAEFNMQRLHLFVEGYDSGLFDLWQVDLYPQGNAGRFPLRVVVPGRNSAQAQNNALRQYPGMRIGATAKVSRK